MIGPLVAGLAAIVIAAGLILFVTLRERQANVNDVVVDVEREP